MKKKNSVLFSVLCLATVVFGQGSLTPSGAPMPTMKTLGEIDASVSSVSNAVAQIKDNARTPLKVDSLGVNPLSGGGFLITQSGSYYLTQNLTVSSMDAIRIEADGVTLDLNGFTIRSSGACGAAINIFGENITVFNGHIIGGTRYVGGEGDQYTGDGFSNGIYAYSYLYTGIRVYGVSVSAVDQYGIYIGDSKSIVKSCTVETAGSIGICAGIISDSSATVCGGVAIYGVSVKNCIGESYSNHGIEAYTVINSTGTSDATDTQSDGIYAYYSVINCYGSTTADKGIQAACVSSSYGQTVTQEANRYSEGIFAKSVQNSCGAAIYNGSGNGIESTLVLNSMGVSYGTNSAAYGIYATIANSSYAIGGEHISNKYNMP